MSKTKNPKNLGGCPTKYTDDMPKRVLDWLKKTKDQEIDGKLNVDLPTVEYLTVVLGVDKQTLYNWEKKYSKFFDALKEVRQEQHKRVLNKSLAGQYNPTIAKLILTNNHGYVDKKEVKQETKLEVTPVENMTTEELAKLYNGQSNT